jgi:acetyl esterase/lipase
MTKIPKEQFHQDLRSSVGLLGIVTYLLPRKWGLKLFHAGISLQKGQKAKGLINEERYIKSNHGGPDIRVRIYRPENIATPLPAFLYMHGGGYSVGCPEQAANIYTDLIARRPCVIIAPAYRRSLQAPYPAAFNDSYDTLLWLNENAEELNIIKDKIIVGGHSAGGGLAAAVTLKARDTQDVGIAFQMPIYPMIEDRHSNKSSKFQSPIWGVKSNTLGWNLYLNGLSEIPAYAAPIQEQ